MMNNFFYSSSTDLKLLFGMTIFSAVLKKNLNNDKLYDSAYDLSLASIKYVRFLVYLLWSLWV